MEEMRRGIGSIQDLLRAMLTVKEGATNDDIEHLRKLIHDDRDAKSEDTLTLRRGQSKTAGPSSEPPEVSYQEEQVLKHFPINKYTKPMHWLLKQKPIRQLIYIKVLKEVYEDNTQFKPDSEFVMKRFLKVLLSDRLQGHFGKATGGGRNLDFSRCPLPMPILAIANEKLGPLHKLKIPGSKDNAEILKERCNDARRVKVLKSDYILGSTSQEEMAIRIFLERIDFYDNHQVKSPFLMS